MVKRKQKTKHYEDAVSEIQTIENSTGQIIAFF